jgi:protein-glucosylgalactosylhydroxylysine glucosidase
LGKGLIPAQECFDPMETFNPTYELAYWRWALTTAQDWRKRANLPSNPEWQKVLDKLSELPKKNEVYLATESTPDCYTSERYRKDHPAVLGAYGMLPLSSKLDTSVMKNTFDVVWKTWFWEETWGWDFPMTAMTAARLGDPEKAVASLFMNVPTNTYLSDGHNYQDKRLRLYLPGNGGLLTAVAMMCAGWDGAKGTNPGFPQNDKWKVKWEGLQKMP